MPISLNRTVASFASLTQADQYFLHLAFQERANSDDPNALVKPESAVGAIIVQNNSVISSSANVIPDNIRANLLNRGFPITPEERYQVIEHAERAAIYRSVFRGNEIANSTMYCTRFPCADCARAIIWSGINRLVVAGGFGTEGAWLSSQRSALKILRVAGIKIRYLNIKD